MICFEPAVVVYYWNEMLNHPVPLCERCKGRLGLPMPGVTHMIRPPEKGEVCKVERILNEIKVI